MNYRNILQWLKRNLKKPEVIHWLIFLFSIIFGIIITALQPKEYHPKEYYYKKRIKEEFLSRTKLYMEYRIDYIPKRSEIALKNGDKVLYYEALRYEECQESFTEKIPELPYYVKIYNILKSFNFSDNVCSGIIGNMLVEVGNTDGETLDVNHTYKNGAYGLCQWLGGRKQRLFAIFGEHPDYVDQCQFIYIELVGYDEAVKSEYLPDRVKTMLKRYVKNHPNASLCQYYSDLNNLLAAKNPETAAYLFCVNYERPGPYNKNRGNFAKNIFEKMKNNY